MKVFFTVEKKNMHKKNQEKTVTPKKNHFSIYS